MPDEKKPTLKDIVKSNVEQAALYESFSPEEVVAEAKEIIDGPLARELRASLTPLVNLLPPSDINGPHIANLLTHFAIASREIDVRLKNAELERAAKEKASG